jgi:hypothetical protein
VTLPAAAAAAPDPARVEAFINGAQLRAAEAAPPAAAGGAALGMESTGGNGPELALETSKTGLEPILAPRRQRRVPKAPKARRKRVWMGWNEPPTVTTSWRIPQGIAAMVRGIVDVTGVSQQNLLARHYYPAIIKAYEDLRKSPEGKHLPEVQPEPQP